jgi:hypothetical protein
MRIAPEARAPGFAPSPRYAGKRDGERGLDGEDAQAVGVRLWAMKTLSPALSRVYAGDVDNPREPQVESA